MSRTPIARHALLSDRHSAALVNLDGSVEWLCFPRFDSPSVFGRLLDDEAGHWSIRPRGRTDASRRYMDQTMVLETAFVSDDGAGDLVDALATGIDSQGHRLGAGAPHLLVREFTCTAGELVLDVEYAPRPEYGAVGPVVVHYGRWSDGPRWCGVAGAFHSGGSHAGARGRARDRRGAGWRRSPVRAAAQHVGGAAGAGVVAGRARGAAGGDSRRVAVVVGVASGVRGAVARSRAPQRPGPPGPVVPAERRDRRRRHHVASRRRRRRTELGLPLLVGARRELHDGGPVGRRLPGRGGGLLRLHDHGGRDVRRCRWWPADHVRRRPGTRPRRTDTAAPPRLAGQPPGARGQRRVEPAADRRVRRTARCGIPARRLHHRHGRRRAAFPDRAGGCRCRALARTRPRDLEVRGEPRHFLYSKVMCWVALDRAIRLAPLLGADAKAEHWQRARDEIQAAVLDRGWSDKAGAFTQFFGSDALEASNLMLPIVGFLPADDPRMLATIDAIDERLTDDRGLVYRYRTEEGVDGLAGSEGSLLLCTFWLAQALALAGRVERARAVFQRAVAYVNDVGLLAEEVDPDTGELLGNFRQAFSHIGLINAAWAISEAE